jgi:hypothetical protein
VPRGHWIERLSVPNSQDFVSWIAEDQKTEAPKIRLSNWSIVGNDDVVPVDLYPAQFRDRDCRYPSKMGAPPTTLRSTDQPASPCGAGIAPSLRQQLSGKVAR